ncbi:MAG: ATP-binding protein [Nocardioidaceae bacterium]
MPEAALLDLLPDGVVAAGADMRVGYLNPAAERLLGASDGLGRPLADVVALQDRAGNEWFACVAPYDGLNTRTALAEQAWYLADGTELLVTARIVRKRPTDPVEQVVVSLRGAHARDRLDRERSDLVATVAHELRSPLTGVKAFVSNLLTKWDRLNDEQKKMMLETVKSDSDRLARLISELLDVARIDTGRLSMYPQPTDFAAAVDTVLGTAHVATGRDITFSVDGYLAPVYADQDKLTQVLTNLVDNAIRHGAGRVRLHASPIKGADPFPGVLLHVDDEGDGISPSIRSRVFTKFWKHGTRAGTGLGMYIIHGLTNAHGGTVDIDDAPDGGARITIRWPSYAAMTPSAAGDD